MRDFLASAIIVLACIAAIDTRNPYDRAVDSAVLIRVGESHGSGAFISETLILTANHVVDEGGPILAFRPVRRDGGVSGREDDYEDGGLRCHVVAACPGKDLALLRVEGAGRPMRLASSSPRPGDRVFAIGSGDEVMFGYSEGCVRQLHDVAPIFPNAHPEMRVINMTAAIDRGSSGGPVVNAQGDLVGISSYVDIATNATYMAVDVSEIRAFLSTQEGLWTR